MIITFAKIEARWRAAADRAFASKCVADIKRHRDHIDEVPVAAQDWTEFIIYGSVMAVFATAVFYWCKKEGWL
jgi:hypothetical protein